MRTVSELVERLTSRAADVAAHLLPAGVLQGREWCAGSIHGEAGKSLKVCVDGSKQGKWADFASGGAGASGDLLDLWCAVRNLGVPEALAEVKQFLGLSDPPLSTTQRRSYRKPEPPTGAVTAASHDSVRNYLTQLRRLSPEALAAYRIGGIDSVGPWPGWKSQNAARGPFIVFPFFRGGELLGVKYLHLNRKDGKKFTLVEPGCEPTCFGWHVVNPRSRSLTICEGELDAASLWQYGHPAVSVPFGGGSGEKQQWVAYDWDLLEAFETIFLCLDNDAEGGTAVKELVRRLGAYRCRVVTLPCKDANECLQAGVSQATIDECFDRSVYLDPPSLKSAWEFVGSVTEQFYPAGQDLGLRMPWPHVPFRFLRGELTVWTGWNGSGKSLLLGQVVLALLSQGERAVIASLEMRATRTLWRIVRQMTAQYQPSRSDIERAMAALGEKLWLHDKVGSESVDTLIPLFDYAYRRFGCRQFVVDSLMRCGVDEDDYRGQKVLVERLAEFADRTDAHVHLVAHARKGQSEGDEVGKLDVKGTGAITDLAFNAFSVWRNKPKESAIQKQTNGEPLPRGVSASDLALMHDAVIRCDKARNVDEGEGRWLLWFDRPSLQYLGPKDRVKPLTLSDFDAPPF